MKRLLRVTIRRAADPLAHAAALIALMSRGLSLFDAEERLEIAARAQEAAVKVVEHSARVAHAA